MLVLRIVQWVYAVILDRKCVRNHHNNTLFPSIFLGNIIMFAIRAVLFFSLVINVLVNGYQEDNANGELKVLLKRLQERLEDEERGYELQDLKERWGVRPRVVLSDLT